MIAIFFNLLFLILNIIIKYINLIIYIINNNLVIIKQKNLFYKLLTINLKYKMESNKRDSESKGSISEFSRDSNE